MAAVALGAAARVTGVTVTAGVTRLADTSVTESTPEITGATVTSAAVTGTDP